MAKYFLITIIESEMINDLEFLLTWSQGSTIPFEISEKLENFDAISKIHFFSST